MENEKTSSDDNLCMWTTIVVKDRSNQYKIIDRKNNTQHVDNEITAYHIVEK